jgi:hypothetical protein
MAACTKGGLPPVSVKLAPSVSGKGSFIPLVSFLSEAEAGYIVDSGERERLAELAEAAGRHKGWTPPVIHCPVCCYEFDERQMHRLPCDHFVCETCLAIMERHSMGESCPKCRSQFGSPGSPNELFEETLKFPATLVPLEVKQGLNNQDLQVLELMIKVIYCLDMRTLFSFEATRHSG